MNEYDAAAVYLAAMREYIKATVGDDANAMNWAYRKMIAAHDTLYNVVKEDTL